MTWRIVQNFVFSLDAQKIGKAANTVQPSNTLVHLLWCEDNDYSFLGLTLYGLKLKLRSFKGHKPKLQRRLISRDSLTFQIWAWIYWSDSSLWHPGILFDRLKVIRRKKEILMSGSPTFSFLKLKTWQLFFPFVNKTL